MQGALRPLQGLGTGSYRTLGQLRLADAGEMLEVVMAWVAEVSGTKAEVHSHRATITTLVLQEIIAMLGTHLQEVTRHAHQMQFKAYRKTLVLGRLDSVV